jgi:transcription elongation GreA/GreB family factor
LPLAYHASVNKRVILAALRKQLEDEIETMTRLAREAAEAAAHPENKPENDKDMRSTEASYVARGQAGRVEELSSALATLAGTDLAPRTTIESGALVTLKSRNISSLYFIVPAAGGRKVRIDGIEITAITTSTPLGEALVGLSAGDEAEVETPQGMRDYEVVKVE